MHSFIHIHFFPFMIHSWFFSMLRWKNHVKQNKKQDHNIMHLHMFIVCCNNIYYMLSLSIVICYHLLIEKFVWEMYLRSVWEQCTQFLEPEYSKKFEKILRDFLRKNWNKWKEKKRKEDIIGLALHFFRGKEG